MDRYDGDSAPDRDAWQALDPDEKRRLVSRHHRGRVQRIHDDGFPRDMHISMHVVIEDQIAAGVPEITRATVERITEEGVRRHVVLHMVIEVLMTQLATGASVEEADYRAALEGLDAGDWLGVRMRRELS